MILDSKRNASPRIAPTRVGLLTLTALFIAATGLYAAPRLALDPAAPSPDIADSSPVVTTEGSTTGNVDPTVDVHDDVHVNILVSTDVLVDPATLDESTPSKPKPPRRSGATTISPSGVARPGTESLSLVGPSGALAIVTAPHPTPAPHPLHAPHPVPAPHAMPLTAGVSVKPKVRAYVSAAASADSSSLEDRMRRLEHMVESIARGQGVKIPENPVQNSFEHSLNWNFEGVTKDLAKEISKEVERATREAQRAMREAQKSADKMREETRSSLATTAKERKPLDASLAQQRANLRRQIAQMERQLEGLENELERMEERFAEAGELSEEAAADLERNVERHRQLIERESKQIEKSREPRTKVKESEAPPAPNAPPAHEVQKY